MALGKTSNSALTIGRSQRNLIGLALGGVYKATQKSEVFVGEKVKVTLSLAGEAVVGLERLTSERKR